MRGVRTPYKHTYVVSAMAESGARRASKLEGFLSPSELILVPLNPCRIPCPCRNPCRTDLTSKGLEEVESSAKTVWKKQGKLGVGIIQPSTALSNGYPCMCCVLHWTRGSLSTRSYSRNNTLTRAIPPIPRLPLVRDSRSKIDFVEECRPKLDCGCKLEDEFLKDDSVCQYVV